MGFFKSLEKVGMAIVSPGTFLVDEAFFAPARRQGRAAERQAVAEGEARKVSQAQQENERQAAIRQQVRKERVRRAQVLSAAEAAGVSGSSVATSTIGSGQTLTQAGQAFASGATLSSNLQSSFLQQAADFNLEGQKAALRGQQFQSAFDIGMKVAGAM
jgi:hypothetical protein